MSLEAAPKNGGGCFCLSHCILLSSHLEDKRQVTNFVVTFDKKYCALSAPPHTKLQKSVVGRVHHCSPLPYQLGIFGFLL